MRTLLLIFVTSIATSSFAEDGPLTTFKFTEITDVDISEYEQMLEHACSLGCAIGWEYKCSSTLAPQNGNNYAGKNLGDSKLATAWVEGANGYGIGQKIDIVFQDGENLKNIPFRGISIVNGYAKSDTAWKTNARVKTMKLYHNEKPIMTLELLDTRLPQEVSFGAISVSARDVVSLEILDVYKGTKYQDTAISEINLYGAH